MKTASTSFLNTVGTRDREQSTHIIVNIVRFIMANNMQIHVVKVNSIISLFLYIEMLSGLLCWHTDRDKFLFCERQSFALLSLPEWVALYEFDFR